MYIILSFVPQEVPARIKCLISVVPGVEIINSKEKDSKRAKLDSTPKEYGRMVSEQTRKWVLFPFIQ
jgi:hypothetical protein